ncbi:major histocompatibility complex class I-related gene protein-like [Scomber scombrus]|uniref:Major histocompatibility complex class I-related gene protein-like n=1 Tax=Scomber scombrus TaxID=13677 RepID=A0AAV1PM42_SCOSC
MVDDVEVAYCDSNNQTAESKQDWMKKIIEDTKPNDFIAECLTSQRFVNETIDMLMQLFNHGGGVHTLQSIGGCDWDNETGHINGFLQLGYDGEDFMSFNPQTETWIVQKQQAVTIIQEINVDKAMTKYLLTQECPDFLKKSVNYGRNSLMRTDFPSVSLLQKTPSSPVSCLATGFYPDRAEIFWRKDGEELHENVEPGEILPNHDGSFQMNVDLNLSSVTPEDWRRYECVFHLSGVKDDIITKLDKAVIRTNWVSRAPSNFPAGPVIIRAAVVLLLKILLVFCITATHIYIWKITKNGKQPEG